MRASASPNRGVSQQEFHLVRGKPVFKSSSRKEDQTRFIIQWMKFSDPDKTHLNWLQSCQELSNRYGRALKPSS